MLAAWWKEGQTRHAIDYGVDAGWNDNNEYGLWDDDATCDGFGEPAPLAMVRPVQALLMLQDRTNGRSTTATAPVVAGAEAGVSFAKAAILPRAGGRSWTSLVAGANDILFSQAIEDEGANIGRQDLN